MKDEFTVTSGPVHHYHIRITPMDKQGHPVDQEPDEVDTFGYILFGYIKASDPSQKVGITSAGPPTIVQYIITQIPRVISDFFHNLSPSPKIVEGKQ